MATIQLQLRGDQIGTFTTLSGTGNGAMRVTAVSGVEALGDAGDIFIVIVDQVNAGDTEFRNGQFVKILNEDGIVVMPRTAVQPDIEQGLGAGDEHLLLPGKKFLFDLGGVPVGPTTVTYTRADEAAGPGGDDDGELDFADFPCFAPGTLIDTPLGPRDVTALAVGDFVTTLDNGAVPIAWIWRRSVDLAEADDGRKPVLVRSGCFGNGRPHLDLTLSPDHRVLILDPAAGMMFGTAQALAPAKGLAGLPRIRSLRGRRSIDYVTMFTRHHQVILANGLPVETLYPGPQALERLGFIGRAGVLTTCPDLADADVAEVYPPARRLLTMTETQALVRVMNLRRKAGSTPDVPARMPERRRPDLHLV